MNVLLIGSGGREHALAWKLAASPMLTRLYAAPGNPGIAKEAELVDVDIADHAAVIAFCLNRKIDLVVVGPEGPLVDGVALLASTNARPAPRSANLTVRPNQLSTEALFAHADGSFWRRHFTANFTPTGADVILWVFDAAGTRARTWRGSTRRRSD